MILGVGTDIMSSAQISKQHLSKDDPFFKRTYTVNEQEEASKHRDSHLYFCERFAAKEAVFKSIGISADRLKSWNQVEVLTSDIGAPYVTLHGGLKKEADRKGICTFHISLSNDNGVVIAFCVASNE